MPGRPRHPGPHELDAFVVAVERAFAVRLPDAERALMETHLDYERSLVVAEAGELVATLGAYLTEVTMPGGRLGAVAALTDVGVVPGARGRGHFRALVETFLAEAHARGEPLAMLNADQAALYPRFGFGMASALVDESVALPPGPLAPSLLEEGDGGELRMLSAGEAAEVAPVLWQLVRLGRVGESARNAAWWAEHFEDESKSPDPVQHAALVRGGEVDGYVAWTRHELAPGLAELVVRELDAVDDAAERALLGSFLARRDAARLRLLERPVDDPIGSMLLDPRVRTVESLRDQLWLRVVDVAGALAARAFPPGRCAIEVIDSGCPWNAGVHELRSDGNVVEVRPSARPPDVRLGVDALASLYLGATTPGQLARAGRLAAASPDALAAFGALFRAERAPFCRTVL